MLLQAAVLLDNRWWVLVRLLASKWVPGGGVLNTCILNMVCQKWGDLFHMRSIERLERRSLLFTVRRWERERQNCRPLLFHSSPGAHRRLHSASAAPLTVEGLAFDSLRSRCAGVIL